MSIRDDLIAAGIIRPTVTDELHSALDRRADERPCLAIDDLGRAMSLRPMDAREQRQMERGASQRPQRRDESREG